MSEESPTHRSSLGTPHLDTVLIVEYKVCAQSSIYGLQIVCREAIHWDAFVFGQGDDLSGDVVCFAEGDAFADEVVC